MTSISQTAAPAQVRAVPKTKARNAAIDRARTFITMLVVIHHSVIAYTHFGHTDRQSFLGFDLIVLFNDSFFMSAMFFLSGLFVWPSILRKGEAAFLHGRFLRLCVPAALVVLPNTGHALNLEEPDLFNRFCDDFFHQVEAGRWLRRDPRAVVTP